jgi:hypothetical protein
LFDDGVCSMFYSILRGEYKWGLILGACDVFI